MRLRRRAARKPKALQRTDAAIRMNGARLVMPVRRSDVRPTSAVHLSHALWATRVTRRMSAAPRLAARPLSAPLDWLGRPNLQSNCQPKLRQELAQADPRYRWLAELRRRSASVRRYRSSRWSQEHGCRIGSRAIDHPGTFHRRCARLTGGSVVSRRRQSLQGSALGAG